MPCGYYRHPTSAACFPAPSGGRLPPSVGQRTSAGKIDVIVWAGLSRRPPQNAKSLRPRQLKRRSKKDLRPRGRFWAQGPQVVPSHLGNPIAENLDPRHGDSDIAPVLRQSFIFFSCSRHSSTLQAYSAPVLRGSAVSRKSLSHISSGRLGTPIGGHLDPRHGESDIAPVLRQSLISLAMFETFVDFGVEHCRSGPSLKIVTFPKDLK